MLSKGEQIGQANCAFAVGVDVSGSAHAQQVLECTIQIITDACRYFFAPGDKITVVPWDSRIREDHVKAFDYADSEEATSDLNAAFEDLENLVDPESRGSNLLDARGYCMEKALAMVEEADGKLCPVVLIFTDIRVSDVDPRRQKYTAKRLTALRKKMGAGEAVEFEAKQYEVKDGPEIVVHCLVGKNEGAVGAGVNRTRGAAARAPTPQRRTQSQTRRRPRDSSGTKALLIILAILSLLAMIALPFAWRHKIVVGETKETLRAFGGRLVVQTGRGISPRGVVYLPVPDLEDQALLAIEGKGPQVLATARRGVRLNDGRTELTLPMGRPVTLRIAIDGIPGEQTLDVQVSEFFATNTGPIIGMIVAFIVLVVCIIA